MIMNDQYDYKLSKCLEKLHEIDKSLAEYHQVTGQLVSRMDAMEKRMEKVEAKFFKLTIVFAVILTALMAHYGPEVFKILKVVL